MSVTILYLVHPVGLPRIDSLFIRDARMEAVRMADRMNRSNTLTYTVSPVECRVVEDDK
jgi:hypothetical protein